MPVERRTRLVAAGEDLLDTRPRLRRATRLQDIETTQGRSCTSSQHHLAPSRGHVMRIYHCFRDQCQSPDVRARTGASRSTPIVRLPGKCHHPQLPLHAQRRMRHVCTELTPLFLFFWSLFFFTEVVGSFRSYVGQGRRMGDENTWTQQHHEESIWDAPTVEICGGISYNASGML